MSETQYHYQWRTPRAHEGFRTGVSLHSHTMHSHENLGFIPRFAVKIPVVRDAVAAKERDYERRNGRKLDYTSSYWTPPLSEREAVKLEAGQIENGLGLKALVSITDHDNIEASNHLHLFEEYRNAPVSVEWTVPYGASFFHLGIHNLPRAAAHEWIGHLAAFTAEPKEPVLRELLEALCDMPDVLVVFNHPMWDEKGLGGNIHRELAHDFMRKYGVFMHALEINGMRPWSENKAAIDFAKLSGHPILSGGDRHGSEANVLINLTNAATFEEFIQEVRKQKRSEVMLLNQYREPHRLRYAEAIWDVMRDYPGHAGRERWTDRFFFRTKTGVDAPLSSVWHGNGPGICGAFLSLMRFLNSRHLRSTLRLAMKDSSEVLP